MANWYASRENIKSAANINGAGRNAPIARQIEAASRRIDQMTRRFFLPQDETRLYRWPPRQPGRAHVLWLDQGLISVDTLQTRAQDASPTTVPASDFFLEPANLGPPFTSIEIDLSSTSDYEAGDTVQRSISVAGTWGYTADTRDGGTVSSGLSSSATATSFVCSDGSLIDVGDTLLIESERIFVSDRAFTDSGETISADLAATNDTVTVPVSDGSVFSVGEIVQVSSESMRIDSIVGNDLTVQRAYDGTTLASHSSGDQVNVSRSLTIERGVNGTTAATHADSTAISVYEPPFDIRNWCIAEVVAAMSQEQSAWGREVGTGDGAAEMSGRALKDYREKTRMLYLRSRIGVV